MVFGGFNENRPHRLECLNARFPVSRTRIGSQPLEHSKVVVMSSEERPVPQGWSAYKRKREADTNRENVMPQPRQSS